MIVRMLKLDNNELDKIINECLFDTVKESIKKIMSISDKEYNDDRKKVISINTQCMLKAGLSMFSEKEYKLVNDKINLMINNLCNGNNYIAFDIVNMIINDRIKNKSRVKKISFNVIDPIFLTVIV